MGFHIFKALNRAIILPEHNRTIFVQIQAVQMRYDMKSDFIA